MLESYCQFLIPFIIYVIVLFVKDNYNHFENKYKFIENRTNENENIFSKQKLKKIVITLLFVLNLITNNLRVTLILSKTNLIRNAKQLFTGAFA